MKMPATTTMKTLAPEEMQQISGGVMQQQFGPELIAEIILGALEASFRNDLSNIPGFGMR